MIRREGIPIHMVNRKIRLFGSVYFFDKTQTNYFEEIVHGEFDFHVCFYVYPKYLDT